MLMKRVPGVARLAPADHPVYIARHLCRCASGFSVEYDAHPSRLGGVDAVQDWPRSGTAAVEERNKGRDS
jgi:hypothetical protein